MPLSSDDLLAFAARQLCCLLLAKHSFRCETQKVIKWAKACALECREIERGPCWWIKSATEDQECLAAAFNMLRTMP